MSRQESNKTRCAGIIASMGLLAAMGTAPAMTSAPAWAAAAGSGDATDETAVASIGTEHYSGVAAAIAAAEAGDTIVLSADEEVSGYIPLDKSLTIDLAGHKLSRTNGNCLLNPMSGTLILTDSAGGGSLEAPVPVWLESGAGFTMDKGNIKATGNGGAAVNSDNGGDISISGGTLEGDFGIFVDGGGSVSISGGEITSKSYAIDVSGAVPIIVSGGAVTATGDDAFAIAVLGTGGSLTMSGGTVKATGSNSVAISDNGNNGQTDITISGGTVESTSDIAVYKPGPGTLRITGGSIAGATGVYQKSGTLSIPANSTATITGNGAKAAYTPLGNGALPTGDAVVIDNAGYPGGDPIIAIDGGVFVSSNAEAVASYSPESRTPEKVFVEGGVFSNEIDSSLVEKEGWVLAQVSDGAHASMWRLVPSDISTWNPTAVSGSATYDGNGHPSADEVPLVLEYSAFADDSGDAVRLEPRAAGAAEDGYSVSWKEGDTALDGLLVDAGTYKAMASGTGKFTGSVEVATFDIKPADISEAEISGVEDADWSGSAETPMPTVKLGDRELVEGEDYTVSYSGNELPGVAVVTVEGKGNYTGAAFKSFIIRDVSREDLLNAIAAAQKSEEGVVESADGSDVSSSSQWTTAAAKLALDEAIAKAQAVAEDPAATAEDIAAATQAVKDATVAYEAAKQAGTKTTDATAMVATGDALPLVGLIVAGLAAAIALIIAAIRRLRS